MVVDLASMLVLNIFAYLTKPPSRPGKAAGLVLRDPLKFFILGVLLGEGKMRYKDVKDVVLKYYPEAKESNIYNKLLSLEREGLIKAERTRIGRQPATYYTVNSKALKVFKESLDQALRWLKELSERIEAFG